MHTFKSFKDLAAHVHAADVKAAQNLRKAKSLPAPKIGPRKALPKY